MDAILLWPTYENIGLDDRNQLELFAAMPGGYDALRTQVHEAFFAAGVRVIWGYNPWDTGTNRYPPVNASWVPAGVNRTDIEVEMVAALKCANADGIDADTMPFADREWFNVSVAFLHHVGPLFFARVHQRMCRTT